LPQFLRPPSFAFCASAVVALCPLALAALYLLLGLALCRFALYAALSVGWLRAVLPCCSFFVAQVLLRRRVGHWAYRQPWAWLCSCPPAAAGFVGMFLGLLPFFFFALVSVAVSTDPGFAD